MEIPKNSLQSKLDQITNSFNSQAPEAAKNMLAQAVIHVSQQQITRRAKQRGEAAPLFQLPNAVGKTISLQNELKKGVVVLVWYRGGWCPYCNTMLHELQLYLPVIKAAGANLLAISPEMPDHSLSTSEKHQLQFEVLSDHDNTVAKSYGITYQLDSATAEAYGKTLAQHNGNNKAELPLAAVYIIDQQGVIRYTFLDADFRRRAEPYDIVATVQNLAKLNA